MHDYRKLRVHGAAVDLVAIVYRETARFPASERYGLTSQMRRAAISVSSNIAEGAGRGSDRDFIRFIHMAEGSLAELASQSDVAVVLGFWAAETTESLQADIESIRRRLRRLREGLG